MKTHSLEPVARCSCTIQLAAALALTLGITALPEIACAADEPSPQTFGPVIETTLKDLQTRTAELLDLDTGKRATSANFGENDRETHAWIRTNRMDIVGVIERGQIAALFCDTAVVPAASNSWSTITPQTILTNWGLNQQEPNKITAISPVTDKTDTFLFRTREGGQGVLQILGPAESAAAIRIRYRLIQPAGKS